MHTSEDCLAPLPLVCERGYARVMVHASYDCPFPFTNTRAIIHARFDAREPSLRALSHTHLDFCKFWEFPRRFFFVLEMRS